MNRSDLIDELAARFGQLTKNDTDLAVTTILDSLAAALIAGRDAIAGLTQAQAPATTVAAVLAA